MILQQQVNIRARGIFADRVRVRVQIELDLNGLQK